MKNSFYLNIGITIATFAVIISSLSFISHQVNSAADRIERRIDFLEYRTAGKTPESVQELPLETRLKRTNGLLDKMVDYCTRQQLPNKHTEGGE